MTGGDFAALLFANLGWATLLMLFILAIRRPFARLFGAGPAYALWLLPVLRLMMPPLPVWGPELPVFSGETVILLIDAAAPGAPAGTDPWSPLLLAFWGIGMAVFLAWQALSYRRFSTEIDRTARSLGAHRGIPVVESAAAQGPLAIGLFARRIVVPVEFASRFSAEERRLALEHEAVHHRRGDLWWNHLGLVVLALNWFNPIAWAAFRAYRADQELACDAAVTSASPEARQDYARALIKSASRPGLIAACPLNHADQLKRRLRMMKNHKVSRPRMLGGIAAVALLAGAGLTLGSPSLAQESGKAEDKAPAAGERREERRVIIIDHRDGHGSDPRRERSGSNRVERREHVVVRHGDHGEASSRPRVHVIGPEGVDIPEHCNQSETSRVDESSDGHRTRVVICSRGSERTAAQRIEGLQRARERIAGQEDLNAEHKQRVLAALDLEIARLRAQ